MKAVFQSHAPLELGMLSSPTMNEPLKAVQVDVTPLSSLHKIYCLDLLDCKLANLHTLTSLTGLPPAVHLCAVWPCTGQDLGAQSGPSRWHLLGAGTARAAAASPTTTAALGASCHSSEGR